MKRCKILFRFLICGFLTLVVASQAWAADLKEIQARGEIRHLGIRYANFVTGDGDGFDVDLVKGFAKHIGVKYQLVYTDFYNVIPLDSRWQRELSNQGVRLDPRVLTSELAYREVEQALCDACFAAGIMPALLDGAVFGVF